MISNEESFLLETLSDFVNKKNTVIPEGLSIPTLRKLSSEQQCGAILFYQTKLPSFERAFASTCFHTSALKELQSDIRQAFSSADISYMILKGPEIAGYYTAPSLRSMGDLDILVHREDKHKARQILLEMGCTTDGFMPHNHEWSFQHPKSKIELHHRLLYSDIYNDEEHVKFADTAWKNTIAKVTDDYQYHLKPDYHFLYLLLHLRKHFLWAGVGIRMFMDLAMMIKNASLNWTYIFDKLQELSLTGFAGVCFAIIERWFGVTAPIDFQRISDDFYERATNDILKSGVNGLTNDNDRDELLACNDIVNMYRLGKHKSLIRFQYLLQLYFPPFSFMQDKYPSMAKSKLFLPLMWTRRAVDTIVRHRIGVGLKRTAMTVQIEKQNERMSKLQDWGIVP